VTEKTVRNIGILGTAHIAQRSVLPALASLPEHFRIAGVGSRSMKAAQMVASQYGCPAYDSYDTLLQDASIDTVYIPLPNGLHYEWVMKALSVGKHVLCEKSLGCTVKEVAEMVHLAEKRNLALMENFQFRFHSQFQELRRLLGLDEGSESRIGAIRAIHVFLVFPLLRMKTTFAIKKSWGGEHSSMQALTPLKWQLYYSERR